MCLPQWVPLALYEQQVQRVEEMASHGQGLIASLRSSRADLDAAQAMVVEQTARGDALTQVGYPAVVNVPYCLAPHCPNAVVSEGWGGGKWLERIGLGGWGML